MELRKILRIGNSYAVVIPKRYFKRLGLVPNEHVSIEIYDQFSLLISSKLRYQNEQGEQKESGDGSAIQN